ncbi:MAG: DUF946 domain-containing protein [Chitinivibrionales bacterium]|nr:DUF946 domain-containing protein [Chitinivibrionales bacterium]MBD3397335.1 DUF946 domain-containing protein [Chitinivibrionales bacterium]
MIRWPAAATCSLTALCISLSAQDSIRVTGTISDGSDGLSRAFVMLKGAELSVETAESGAFEIVMENGGTSAKTAPCLYNPGAGLHLSGGQLLFSHSRDFSGACITAHDVRGRLLVQKTVRAGTASLPVNINRFFPSSGNLILTISSGKQRSVYQIVCMDGRTVALEGPRENTIQRRALARAAAAPVDTLIVNRIGFYPRRIALNSYIADFSGTDKIVMQHSDLPCIDVGGLLLGFVDQFELLWWDKGSGADWDGSYWRPVVDSTNGFTPLGSYGRNLWSDPSGKTYALVVKEIDTTALAAPVDYTLIWKDQGTGSNIDGSFWQPVPPEGYVACGTVAEAGWDKPSLDRVVCVREDLATAAEAGSHFWYYMVAFDGGAINFKTSPIKPKEEPTFGTFPLSAGTFVAYIDSAPVPEVYCLDVSLPMVMKNNVPPALPGLSGLTEPPGETQPHFGRVMMVPFSVINDTTTSIAWQVENTPFYRVERYQYYTHSDLLYYINNGSSDYVWSEAITTGITEEQSQRFWHSTGISVTANAGFEFKGFSAGVSVTVSQEFGYESSSSISTYNAKTTTKTVTVAPHCIGVLWQKCDLILMKRCNVAGDCQTVGSETVPLESYYYDEIPVP